MSSVRPHLAPDEFFGRKLGKYEILCRLSTGGMSEIFLAFQRGLAGFTKFVVLKQILPDIRDEEAFVRMFLREAKISAALTHPNIAQVFDLDVDDGEMFLAMEFVQGATLVEIARACRDRGELIPLGMTLAAVRDTARALHYAHTFQDPTGRIEQVIHRDVAEKNIMLSFEGVTKLLDFGIAKNLASEHRTRRGILKGTVGYIAPEQISGQPLDARSDVFSLGVVLYQCLTEVMLFHGSTPEEQLEATLRGDIVPPSRRSQNVPQELDAVVLRALERDRERRYPTALDFARELERVAGDLVWRPDQSATFIRRLFADQFSETQALLGTAQQHDASDLTSQYVLQQLRDTREPIKPTRDEFPAAARASAPPRADAASAATGSDEWNERASNVEGQPEFTNRATVEIRGPRDTAAETHPPLEERQAEEPRIGRRRTASELPAVRDQSIITVIAGPGSVLEDDATSQGPRPLAAARVEVDDEPRTTYSRTMVRHHQQQRVRIAVAAAALFCVVAALTFTVLRPDSAPSPANRRAPRPLIPPTTLAFGPDSERSAEPEPSREPAPAPARPVETSAPAPSPVAPPAPTPTNTVAPPAPRKAPAPKPPAPKKQPVRLAAASRTQTRTDATAASEAEAAFRASAVRPAPAANEPGQLTLVTEPKAQVLFKSQSLGTTPLQKVPLPPGSHTLRLKGPDDSIRVLQVKVESGMVTHLKVKLETLSED